MEKENRNHYITYVDLISGPGTTENKLLIIELSNRTRYMIFLNYISYVIS